MFLHWWDKKKKQEKSQLSYLVTSVSSNTKKNVHVYLVEGTNLQPIKLRSNLLNSYCKVYIMSLEGKNAQQSIRNVRESTTYCPSVINTLNPIWDYMITLGFGDETDCVVVDVHDQISDSRNPLADPLLGRVCVPLQDIIDEGVIVGNTGMVGCQKWFQLFSKNLRSRASGQLNIRLTIDTTSKVSKLSETQMKLRCVPPPIPKEEKISLFIATWNCGNAGPPDDLAPWISVGTHDLYVIGSQECKYSPREGFTNCKEDWRAHLVRHFGRDYTLVTFKSYWEIRLAVFVRNQLKHLISGLTTHKEATGIGNVLGNKGGRIVAFFWNQTALGFGNAHLAAHTGFTAARNQNARDILKNSHVGLPRPAGAKGPVKPSTCNQFDYFFFFGDLNYRLEFFDDKDTNNPTLESHIRIVQNIEVPGGRKMLFAHDQLNREMKTKQVFYKFEEGNPWEFRPTFKMERHEDFLYTTQRAPAWTDRILWRKLDDNENFELMHYNSAEMMKTSDHKPVVASFTIPVTSLHSAIDPIENKCFKMSINTIRATGLRLFVTAEQQRKQFLEQTNSSQVRKAFKGLGKKIKEQTAAADHGFILQFYGSFLPCSLISLVAEDTWSGVFRPETTVRMQSEVDQKDSGIIRSDYLKRPGEQVDVKVTNTRRLLTSTIWVRVLKSDGTHEVAHGAICLSKSCKTSDFAQKDFQCSFFTSLDMAGSSSGSLKGELRFTQTR